jgi:PAS domain S-box-containing protein
MTTATDPAPGAANSDLQRRLKALADRFAVVTEAMSEGVYDWDIGSGRLEVSGRLNAITGLDPKALTAEDWNQRIHPDDFDAYRQAIVRHFKAETDRMVCEYRIKRTAGDYIWIADTGRCLRSDTGEALRLIGAVRDITGRKLAEQKLKAAQSEAETTRRQLLDAIESIAEGIVMFDAEDRVILCNSNFKRYFAATAGEAVAALIEPGAVFWDFLREAHARGMLPIIDQKGGIDAYIEMRKVMRRDPQEPIEQLLSDGRWLQISEHKTATGGIASVYTDITELKKREVDLSAKSEMLESLSSRLSKYLSPQVYSSIFSAADSVEIAPKRKKLTVFFSDIVGFTTLVDALESEELTDLLNQYLTAMSEIAVAHGATVDKFIGDGIVAFFGDPQSHGVEQDARACVDMALAMQARLADMRRGWQDKGLDETFELRIGIATGFCTVGNFGSKDRLDYTAIGNAVNLAARLQASAESGGIVLDNETFHLVRGAIGAVEELNVPLKGFAKPVRAFRIRGRTGDGADDVVVNRRGVQIRIDGSGLTEADREAALQALQSGLDVLRKRAPAKP